ncbi:HpcH/HpaI aldolase/citrate lyase family protein [Agromyces ramosus]|uniref:Citrate lyase subunit beta/citryl-CoA lyase n=1 Tax=Agromyces ramosus TaxID=33879 RepID=A0ABU0R3X1_9MICO|nr:aldolase/citrate lyase family protein [Agromyces ramosus]MDQ0892771.1 citrate lyase subunit beta/citryl-CoA lyase [Agromyces ramosus]
MDTDVRVTSRAPAGTDSTVPAGLARSWLLVPGSAPGLASRVAASGADVVVVDLEDGVAPADKGRARHALAAAADAGLRPWVRIADVASDEWRTDVALLRGRDLVAGVVLAKVEAPDQLRRTLDALGGGLPLVALVESARGIESALDIAETHGVARLAFGSGDFRRDTGAADDPLALLYARSRLVSTSRAAGLPGPIDGPTVRREAAALTDASRHAASVGMTGRLCLREEQVDVVNAALSPSGDELAWALEVLDTLERCGIRDGSDLPRIARARAICDAAEAFGIEVDAAAVRRSDYAR